MTINQSLNWAIKELKKAKIYPVKWSRSEFNGVNSAVLDAEALLSFAIKKPKEWILTHPEKEIGPRLTRLWREIIKRRCKHEPVAYITGNKEFFGLDFFVDKNVLIPRPETEMIVEEAIKIITTELRKSRNYKNQKDEKINLIDIGTGSGCIPISILKWIPASARMTITAVDSSAKALKIARKNAAKHKVKINFIHGNLLDKILQNYKNREIAKTIITANLPYLSDSQYKKLPPEIKKYEPKNALVAGKDGLKYYRELLSSLSSSGLSEGFTKIKGLDSPNKSGNDIILLLEIDPTQSKKIKKIIKKFLPNAKVEIQKDLAKRDRLVVVKIND